LTDSIGATLAAIRADSSSKHDAPVKSRKAAGHAGRAKSLADFPQQRNAKRLSYDARKQRVAEKKAKIAQWMQDNM
jgi:hypothetical protein